MKQFIELLQNSSWHSLCIRLMTPLGLPYQLHGSSYKGFGPLGSAARGQAHKLRLQRDQVNALGSLASLEAGGLLQGLGLRV